MAKPSKRPVSCYKKMSILLDSHKRCSKYLKIPIHIGKSKYANY